MTRNAIIAATWATSTGAAVGEGAGRVGEAIVLKDAELSKISGANDQVSACRAEIGGDTFAVKKHSASRAHKASGATSIANITAVFKLCTRSRSFTHAIESSCARG